MPVTIIAEAGVNHNGDLAMAKEMAPRRQRMRRRHRQIPDRGAELVVSKFAEKAEYQKQTTGAAESSWR